MLNIVCTFGTLRKRIFLCFSPLYIYFICNLSSASRGLLTVKAVPLRRLEEVPDSSHKNNLNVLRVSVFLVAPSPVILYRTNVCWLTTQQHSSSLSFLTSGSGEVILISTDNLESIRNKFFRGCILALGACCQTLFCVSTTADS